MRRGASWTGSPSAGDWVAIASTTRRGFTGHTMLDNLNLTHMNGRVYDPMLGRFVSADPTIPDPLSTQSYNRYSYVQNNPLTMIDPSGFQEVRPCDSAFCSFDGDHDDGEFNLGGCVNAEGAPRSDFSCTYLAGQFSLGETIAGTQSSHHPVVPGPTGGGGSTEAWSGCMRPDLLRRPVADGVMCDGCTKTLLQKVLPFLPAVQQELLEQIGDSVAPFRDDSANPITGRVLFPKEINDQKFLNVVNIATLGDASLVGRELEAAESAPELIFSRSRAPGIAKNFDDAVSMGKPTRLNRATQVVRDANRREALRGQSPAPAGQSLDEYPFACSTQGGAGACVRAVPVGEQSYQGGVLSSFFDKYNIGPGDPFQVTFGP